MLKHEICQKIYEAGGSPYYIGGCVRDEILGIPSKDVDIEVFGLRPGRLSQILEPFGVNFVGRSFGVEKVRRGDEEIDVSMPRHDRHIENQRGHKAFTVEFNPFMSVREAASRRDFTINAIYKHAITGDIVDPFRGIDDLHLGILNHIGPAFKEDPLRVLRGMQFASRFNLEVSEQTADVCYDVIDEYTALPIERVGEEWRKWCEGDYPSRGIQFLVDTAWIDHFKPLKDLIDCQQDESWHPEGDVMTHCLYVCDAMAGICNREAIAGEDREVLMMAALCHDLGKPSTTTFDGEPPRWRARGHDAAGVPIAAEFLRNIGIFDRVIQRVLPLVNEHMFPCWDKPSRRTIRRLKVRLKGVSIDWLLLLMEADRSGRCPHPPSKAENDELIRELAAEPPSALLPIITGRHIMACGVTNGKDIGRIKRVMFEWQLDEQFQTEEEGITCLKKYLEHG